MTRSLRVATPYIKKVKQSLFNNGFPSQQSLAGRLLLSRDTVSKFFNGKLIDRTNFEVICHRLKLDWQEITNLVDLKADWGVAPEILDQNFVGRDAELDRLESWILDDRCRLIAIVGMGGIGKTELSLKLARDVHDGFDYLIWRSLLNIPSFSEIMMEWIKFLSDQKQTSLPESITSQISLLLGYLKEKRCLLILDNAESTLESNGKYKQGYEGYGQLFEAIGSVEHQSCLIVTSREKFSNLERLERKDQPVRFFELSGLSYAKGRELFKPSTDFSGTEQQWQELNEFYNGNPLALTLAARHIREMFSGDIDRFWQDDKPVFSQLEELLDWHFERLNSYEQEILYWLAIHREPVSINEIKEDIFAINHQQKISDTLRSLQRKLPIERTEDNKKFSLQPVLIEYVTQKLIDTVCKEVETEDLAIFNTHSLLQAQAKDYIRESQNRTILELVKLRLIDSLHGKMNLEKHLKSILIKLQDYTPLRRGYIAGNILNLLCQLKTDLTGYDFSNLTIWQADLRNIELQNVNFANSDVARTSFRKSFGGVLCVAFSPDGKYLAVGDFNGEIHLLQVDTWEEFHIFIKHPWHVAYIAFSPDSKYLVSSCLNNIIKLWDVATGQLLWSKQEHTRWIWCVNFHPNAQMLASASDDTTIKFWDVSSGECLMTIPAHDGWVLSVAFSPDGKILASGSFDRTIKLWDVKTGKHLKTFVGSKDAIWTVVFSPDGKAIASCGLETIIRLWNVETGECFKTLSGHTKEIKMICFSPDGKAIASGAFNPDLTVRFWDVATGQCQKTGTGHISSVRTIAYHPHRQMVATGDVDQILKIWDTRSGSCLKTLQGHTHAIWSVAYSHDGRMIASSYLNRKIRLWHIEDCFDNYQNQYQPKLLEGHDCWIWEVAFSPDLLTLASCGDDETIRIWDIKTGKIVKTLEYGAKNYQGGIWAISYSPNGKILASAGQDGIVKIWNLDTQNVKLLTGHSNWIMAVAFNPDGKTLASAGNDCTFRIWDANSGEALHIGEGHRNKLRTLAYSTDGLRLATGSEDRTIKIWDAITGKCLNTLQGHNQSVFSLDFSERLIVSGSEDSTARIWDALTGKCLYILKGHQSIVKATKFSPDGQYAITAGLDSIIKIWDVNTGKCLETLTVCRPYEGMNITAVTGMSRGQKESLKSLGGIEA